MAPPPPPPPGPPPPPNTMSPPSSNSGQERNMLLESIRHGTKLKKTVTNDKSGPFIGGKVSGTVTSNNNNNINNKNNESSRVNGTGGAAVVPMGLGGLFAGGIPKLKSTGLNIGLNNSLSQQQQQQQQQQTTTKNNRGPPPQPPPAYQKPNIPSSASDSTITSTTTLSSNGFAGSRTNKPPVGGYGKPNLAPKPPSALHHHVNSLGGSEQNLSSDYADHLHHPQHGSVYSLNEENNVSGCGGGGSKPSPPPKKLNLNNRPMVTRAQSMRCPRSPPATADSQTNININNNVNNRTLVRNKSGLHQSQNNLVKTGTLPNNFHGGKMAPSPPNIPPPPTPTQSHRGTPTRPPGTKPPPPPSRFGTNMPPPPAPPCTAPPPPPHRTSPAPQPPKQLPPPAPNSAPPAPPARVSSMRNGGGAAGSQGQSELELRFSHLFHQMQEFPAPGLYRNVTKTYNSRNPSTAKQQAPQPPAANASQLQSGIKLWASNSSQC